MLLGSAKFSGNWTDQGRYWVVLEWLLIQGNVEEVVSNKERVLI
jgi:hypothetical protein